jgi:hypothetical protein
MEGCSGGYLWVGSVLRGAAAHLERTPTAAVLSHTIQVQALTSVGRKGGGRAGEG